MPARVPLHLFVWVAPSVAKHLVFFLLLVGQVALDFLARRSNSSGNVRRERRLQYAEDYLQKELLPHIGVSDNCRTKKAFFLGYMVHRVLLAATRRRNLVRFWVFISFLFASLPGMGKGHGVLGRSRLSPAPPSSPRPGPRAQDDRDHFGNKRMDLAGPLLASLFRGLFKKLAKDMRLQLQRRVNAGRDINLIEVVRPETIKNGLKVCYEKRPSVRATGTLTTAWP